MGSGQQSAAADAAAVVKVEQQEQRLTPGRVLPLEHAESGEAEDDWVPLGEEGEPGFRAALFSRQAANYAAYRPGYPDSIYRRIYEFSAEASAPNPPCTDLVLDVGSGPGKAAVALAQIYKTVVATDPSPEQLAHAERRPNIHYHQVAAEHLSELLLPHSVDLITVAETLHWCDHVRFYDQARSLLKPNGAIAIWCYDIQSFVPTEDQDPELVEEANRLIMEYTYTDMAPFWDDGRKHLDTRYQGLVPKKSQFRVCLREESSMEQVVSLSHFMGYMTSWSPYAAYKSTFPDREDPLIPLYRSFKRLLNVTDDDAPCVRIVFPLVLLLVRDPVPLTASAPPSRTSLEGRIAGLSVAASRLGGAAGCGGGAAGGSAGSSVADSDDAGGSGEPAASS